MTRTRSELAAAMKGLSAARDLPMDVILEALQAALVSAYRKTADGDEQDVFVDIDPTTGEARVFASKLVVESVEDERAEIAFKDAHAYRPDIEVGQALKLDVTPDDFGRIAAQAAKQVILQRIREAEREQTYSTYADREGEVVYGTVQSVGRDHVTIALERVEAALPRSDQIPGEDYHPGKRMRVYVTDVRKTPRGPQVIVSRTHRDMLKRLMEVEIPEIFQGMVEVKAVAREAGSRSKVAVFTLREGVDPVGACVGMRGVRIQALVRELGGEKIDIVHWDRDPRVFIAHALSPARVLLVELQGDGDRPTASVIVPDSMLSLAIGREGQNARLAAKLTGWRIDIRSESEAAEDLERFAERERQRKASMLAAAQPAESEVAADGLVGAEALEPLAEAEVDVETVEPAEGVAGVAVAETPAPSVEAEAVEAGAAAPAATEAEKAERQGKKPVVKKKARRQTEEEDVLKVAKARKGKRLRPHDDEEEDWEAILEEFAEESEPIFPWEDEELEA